MTMLGGKIVVVTGGASGIGRAIALAAARHGAGAVVIGDIVEVPREGGAPTARLLQDQGVAARHVVCDVGDPAGLEALMAAAAALGGVDVMACNAGIIVPGDDASVGLDDYRRIMRVNTDGAFHSARAAAAQMRATGKRGSIVLTASIGGLRGFGQAVAYSASKGAVCLLAASLADALGPEGIRVNAVCPGFTATQMMAAGPVGEQDAAQAITAGTPLRRLGRPEEIAEAVCWLGSDLASFVTGVALPVDGGHSANVH